MTITVNLPPDVAGRLRRQAAAQGSDLPALVQRLAEREAEAGDVPIPARIPGLHAGQYEVSDDFDAPLPESFWLGRGEGQAP